MRWAFNDPYCWRRWFAWHPVRVGEEWVWLEWVERHRYPPKHIHDWPASDYRPLDSDRPS